MSLLAATIVVLLFTAYAAVGLLFALAFIIVGVQRIDSRAAGAGAAFRILIAPGAAALWPPLALRWLRAVRTPD